MTISSHQVREDYQTFFEKRGHKRIPAASLVPENDPSTLFTGSGMQPLIPYLLGQQHPQGSRLTDSQVCLRVQDIDDVGDNRHTTFFEMLGNWSLGDYFKTEQIGWIFEFLTETLRLDPSRLYITVFAGNNALGIPRDTKTVELWQNLFGASGVKAKAVGNGAQHGLQEGRIFYYDEAKNWWSRAGIPANMPIGEPGGPDTEMFWDFGAERQLHESSVYHNHPCHVNCDCGRFMEIGNNVFIEYIKTSSGFSPLPQKNVDFGGGLERLTAVTNDNPDVFMIDIFENMRAQLEKGSSHHYGQDRQSTRAFRIIMDHLRAVTFLIAQDVLPANKEQGYFTRRLLRRAVRYTDSLGLNTNYGANLCTEVIAQYGSVYPDLIKKKTAILAAVTKEEDKFRRTLKAGLQRFKQITENRSPRALIPAQEIFDLYQTYGFPLELSKELADEMKLVIEMPKVRQIFKRHQSKSRLGADYKFKGGLADHSAMSIKYHTTTHLLHQALRTVLGNQIRQKGSNITSERLRFDFAYHRKLTAIEIAAVEKFVNDAISAELPVRRDQLTLKEAKELGAIGLFEEKYQNQVSVYSIGDISCEICGGPHVTNTRALAGKFKIIKEESAGADIRRIRAIIE